MKKNTIYLCLVATMLATGSLTSCGDDDDKNKTENNKTENNQTDENNNQTDDPNTQKPDENQPTERAAYTPLQNSVGTIPANAITLAEAQYPAEVLKAMGMGWNLGNQFDAHNNGVSGETAWGQPLATQATFDKVAAAGIKTVRIPVTWMGHIGEAPDYKIEDAWLDRVYEVVGYAKNAGLNAIINIHHDGAANNSDNPKYKGWLKIGDAAINATENQQTKEKIAALWKQIAEKFKDTDHFLMFEAFNEIQDGGWGRGANRNDGDKQYKTLNEWLQIAVDAIRSTGGKNTDRWIGIPAYNTNIDLCEKLVLPDDPAHKLMVSVHYYDPHEYTLTDKYKEWGHTAQSSKTPSSGQEQDCQTMMKKMFDRYTSKGIPAYVGEMGNVNRLEAKYEKFRAYYFEYVTKCIHDNYMPAILWDNGVAKAGEECHGYFNHGTGEWMNDYSKQMIDVMVKAMTTEDAAYTLQSVYDSMK